MELLIGAPGRGFHAHTHNHFGHTHHYSSKSRVQLHNTADHRRPHSTSHPNRRLQALPSWTGAHGGNGASRASEVFRRPVHHSNSPRTCSSYVDPYKTELDSLLAALRQSDAIKLYFCLLDFTRGASLDNQSFCRAVQSIPPTTFSEILRNFDPFHVSNHVDSAPGIAISWGAAIYSPLGDLINKWGVKILYVRILNRLRLLQRARQVPRPDGSPSQLRPLLRDYLVLLRCAGATSDIQVAKAVWWELFVDGYGDWKHAELFAEFIKARYLTEALYANHDLARFRLRPLDMHRSVIKIKRDGVRKLKHLHAALTDKRPHRFGQNVNEHYFAEPLTRLLRKRNPLKKLERRAIIRYMIPGDESLLCAILKANGRHGRVYASNVLMRFWGIEISNYKSGLGNREISGGHDFSSGSAQAPTEALLDAVVHCYGNMGEVLLAKALVDFISRRWSIAVPDKVWSDLMDFARIFSTDPAAREWRLAELPRKLIQPDMVLRIWEFCTQEPHKFQPGIKDYYNLIKSMLGPQQPLDGFLRAIRQLMPLYNRTAQQMRVAWAELILTTQQGVPNHAAYRQYRVLQSSKNYMWYCFHYAARQTLKKLYPRRVDSVDAVRHIPNLVAELGPFLRTTIQYRIATGIVNLSLDYNPLRITETEQTLQKPEPLSHRLMDRHRPTTRPRGNKPVDMDWATIENTTNGPGLSTALRDYMKMMGIKQGEEMQLGQDEHIVEEDEEEDAGQESLYSKFEEETQPGKARRIDEDVEMGDIDEIGDREEMDRRVIVRAPRPERHFQDAFEESRNPEYKPLVAEDFEKILKKDSELSKDSFAEAFARHHEDKVDTSSTSQHSHHQDRDTTANTAVSARRRWATTQQLLERPAYMWRPRFSAPPGEPSLSALRQDGKEFTGFHEDPLKAHFAAHRIIRRIAHAPGVPVNLGGPGLSADKGQLAEHLLWMKT